MKPSPTAVCTLIALALWHVPVSAACWKVTDVKGVSMKSGNGYAPARDAYSSQSDGTGRQDFEVRIEGKEGSVTPGLDSCSAANARTLICIANGEGQSMVNVWAIDTAAGKVYTTKTMNGYGRFDGGNLSTGRIIGKCDSP